VSFYCRPTSTTIFVINNKGESTTLRCCIYCNSGSTKQSAHGSSEGDNLTSRFVNESHHSRESNDVQIEHEQILDKKRLWRRSQAEIQTTRMFFFSYDDINVTQVANSPCPQSDCFTENCMKPYYFQQYCRKIFPQHINTAVCFHVITF
jgi:hypothetical protein